MTQDIRSRKSDQNFRFWIVLNGEVVGTSTTREGAEKKVQGLAANYPTEASRARVAARHSIIDREGN